MVKNHLKRITLPRTWDVPRKSFKRMPAEFVSMPNAGKTMANSMAVNNFLRDVVKVVGFRREVKFIIRYKSVLVNGVEITDEKYPVGLFDVVSIPEIKANYRVMFDERGKLVAVEINEAESLIIPRRIEGRSLIKGKKMQVHLYDGGNILVDKNTYSNGDVLVMKGKEVTHVMKLHPKNKVMLVAGQHIGKIGKVVEVKGDKIIVDDGSEFETLTKYAYVIADDKVAIKVR
jgi:small subunit ribosomal protein S4e